jgi:hypothetical protein
MRDQRTPPYAPFRAGAPTFSPALRPISPADWLQPDTEAHVLDWKRGLLADPERVLRQSHKGRAAATEAAARVGDAFGATSPDLLTASGLVSDDLVVMERDGEDWLCTGLTLTAPTFFSIDQAFGHDLTALHGPVPDGRRLARRIGRVFDGLQPGTVLERFNWTLQCGPERFTPDATPLRARAATTPAKGADTVVHLRVERQTIVKLAHTGAVLFTIRVCLDPLTALQAEDRPALATAWRALHGEGRTYKRWDAMDRLVGGVFARWGV